MAPARGAARAEDKVRLARGFAGEHAPVVQDDEAAIEQFPELDLLARPAPPAGAGRQLHAAQGEAHGVVVSDAAVIPAGELEREVARRAPPGRLRAGRGPREAPVVVGEESGQEGIGGVERSHAAQA